MADKFLNMDSFGNNYNPDAPISTGSSNINSSNWWNGGSGNYGMVSPNANSGYTSGPNMGGGYSSSIGNFGSGDQSLAPITGPMEGGTFGSLMKGPTPGGAVPRTGWQDAFGGSDENGAYGGYAVPMIQGVGAIAQSFLGWQQLKESKKQFAQGQENFEYNANNQATLTNARMEDRQNARNASSPGYWQSTEEFMAKNKVNKVNA
jgi:hypothetical protein